MPIKCDLSKVMDGIQSDLDTILDAAQLAMRRAAKEVVRNAKLLNTYQDQTKNLRSSIGCVVYDDGQMVEEFFSGTGNGTSTGRKLARDVASKYDGQLVAVIVAGMHYAVYVESKGFDVISGPMLNFTEIFERNFKAALGK